MAGSKPEKGDVVVAVDFGTTKTAVAYTIVGKENEVINVIQLQKAGSLLLGDPKTSTSLLMEGDKTIAFGHLAEEKFAAEADKKVQWKLFQAFKMGLHNPNEPDPLVQSVGSPECFPLSRLLMKSLEYVKESTVDHLKDNSVLMSGDPHDVFWVLTVPAIWNEFSKSLMRQAAHQAGLIRRENSDKLILALEPECAAVFSQKWDAGTKFMIADCGGGTLDITTHEVIQTAPLKLKEIRHPTGGSFGGRKVDEKFTGFISSFLGEKYYDVLSEDYLSEYFELLSQWEKKKVQLTFDPEEDEWTEIILSRAFEALDLSKKDLLRMVREWNSSNPNNTLGCPKARKKSIHLPPQLVRSFFTEIVEDISQEICRAPMDGINYIVLAGGFSKCPLIKPEVEEAVRERKRRIEVVLAREPDLCIVKGAAKFGTDPKERIKSRKSPFTIGVATVRDFNYFSLRDWWNSTQMITSSDGQKKFSIFSPHVYAGDTVSSKNCHSHYYGPVTKDHRFVSIQVLITEKRSVHLENDPDVRCICETEVDLGDMMNLPFKDRGVWVEFSFGGAEIRCHVFDKDNKRERSNFKLDFKFHKKASSPCTAEIRG